MRIDLIVDGVVYHSVPYIGEAECLDCDLSEKCDLCANSLCSLYAPSKVIFKKEISNGNLPNPIPSPGDKIKIIAVRSTNPNCKYKEGDVLDVVRSWDSTLRDDDRILVRVRASRGRYKIINSHQYAWDIIKQYGKQ